MIRRTLNYPPVTMVPYDRRPRLWKFHRFSYFSLSPESLSCDKYGIVSEPRTTIVLLLHLPLSCVRPFLSLTRYILSMYHLHRSVLWNRTRVPARARAQDIYRSTCVSVLTSARISVLLRGPSDTRIYRDGNFSPKFAVDDDDDTIVDNVVVRTFAAHTWNGVAGAFGERSATGVNFRRRRVSEIYFRGLMQTGCASLLRTNRSETAVAYMRSSPIAIKTTVAMYVTRSLEMEGEGGWRTRQKMSHDERWRRR